MKLGEKDKSFIRLSKALGITNKKIAEKIGCTEQAVWHYLKKNPLTVEEHKEAMKKEIDQTELEMHLENAEEVFQPDNIEEVEVKQEEDKCAEFDIEAAHIINELAAKNQELQKELHISKNVITTLQKGVEELNEIVTESKCMIAEICKERDDKDEETIVLKLDLLKKDNNMDKLVEEFREMETKYENLLEVLETKKLNIELNPKNDSLYKVLLAAYNQASNGKGKERHQLNDDEPFENQKICEISRRLGSNDYNLGQAVKKIYESKRLPKERAIAELLGAINYIAAGIIILDESEE